MKERRQAMWTCKRAIRIAKAIMRELEKKKSPMSLGLELEDTSEKLTEELSEYLFAPAMRMIDKEKREESKTRD